MNTEIIVALIGILSTVVSSVITFVLTKKKYNAEVDKQVIENLQQSLEFYIKLCDDTNARLEEYSKESDLLRKQVADLQSQVLSMSVNLCYNLTCANRKLQKEIQKKNRKNGTDTPKKVEEK